MHIATFLDTEILICEQAARLAAPSPRRGGWAARVTSWSSVRSRKKSRITSRVRIVNLLWRNATYKFLQFVEVQCSNNNICGLPKVTRFYPKPIPKSLCDGTSIPHKRFLILLLYNCPFRLSWGLFKSYTLGVQKRHLKILKLILSFHRTHRIQYRAK